MELTTIILLWSLSCYTLINSTAVDTIRPNQTIKDGETVVSAGGEFELGFFSPGSSTNRYLGIWYKKISHGTVVWVANRETPLNNTLGLLRVHGNGITLQTVDSSHGIIWSANTSKSLKNPSLQLLDTGNLVLRDEGHDINDTEDFIWQSFDQPGDTALPGMKFGIDLVTGINRYYTSWTSSNDPSLGSFTYQLDSNGFPQFILRKDSVVWSRFGPWIGSTYSGIPNYNQSGYYKYTFALNEKEIYSQFDLINKTSPTMRVVLTSSGEAKILAWNDQQQIWVVKLTQQVTDCDHYGSCGAYGICNINKTPRCECLRGFVAKFPKKWEAADWSSGCIRRTNLVCGTEEGFVKFSAYANTDVRSGGHGCVLWFKELTDIRDHIEDGQDIYVRMPSSELGKSRRSRAKRRIKIYLMAGLLTLVLFVVLTLGLLGMTSLYIACRKRKRLLQENLRLCSGVVALNKTESEDMELPLFEFERVANATSNFSDDNKLGHGGYGPVYKVI